MQTIVKQNNGWRQATDPPDSGLRARWDAIALPGGEHTENALSAFLQGPSRTNRVLHCAIPLARAKTLTDFSLPDGLTIQQCIGASATGNFPECLRDWEYTPQIRAVPQISQMMAIPAEHASLTKLPWFQSASQSAWLGINARHLRYHYQLWQDLKPQVLQGVVTTLILGLPQIGFALAPHIQLEKSFLFLASLARGLCPVQLFPAKYLYPQTKLGELADAPAPIFADILPATGGFAYPVVDCEPDPWRVLARFGNGDRFYGYPFRKATDSWDDFSLQDYERGAMLLPNGSRVTARHSESHIYATLDPDLKTVLALDREGFEDATCLVRGACTHDGLPFQLPVEMQPMVFAIVLTHWRMELDRPGDLTSYAVYTEHAAIRGFNYFQRVEPYYANFMRLIQKLSKDPDFRTYPLANHLTQSWLGGNVCRANQLSQSERELGPQIMRSYYHQQLDWQAAIINLMNHVAFRTKNNRGGLVSKTGAEIEDELNLDGLAMHQMNRLLRFDSHLFRRPGQRASCWPDHNPAWSELDRRFSDVSLPKL